MKVAYFTESLPPHTDGVSHTLSHLASTLSARDVDFRFFAPFKPDNSIPWSDRVHKVPSIPFFLYRDYRVGLPVLMDITTELDGFDPDIIHIASPTPLGISGLNYARKHDLPAVSSYHTHFISYFPYYRIPFLEGLGWAYMRWFYTQCDATYAPSRSAIDELQSRGIPNVKLCQRGVEIDRFCPGFRDMELRESIGAGRLPILLFVGRLVKEKDLDDLVDTNNYLQQRGYIYKLVLVGEGPMKSELMQRLPKAHFTGLQRGESLARWYASADVFVFPSTTETFGNVIQEAFASGIPAVGVRKGGVVDLIEESTNGFLAEPNHPKDFAAKVAPLIEHADLRHAMGEKARLMVEHNTWAAINERLLHSYDEVISSYYS
jgi:glycosyltransferase involved in cell wall biosynthesis